MSCLAMSTQPKFWENARTILETKIIWWNVLLVENMKHNLLSVIQMCNQGHILIFNLKEYEIRKEGQGILVATTTRTPNNIYILNEIGKESCCLGNEDESWLGTRECAIYTMTILSISARSKLSQKCLKLQKQPILCANIVSMENKQRLNSRQRNNLHQNHWKMYTLIFMALAKTTKNIEEDYEEQG